MRILLFAGLLLLAVSPGLGQQTGTPLSEALSTRPFTEIAGPFIDITDDAVDFQRSEFKFAASGFKYTISKRGRGKREGIGERASGERAGGVRRFDLRLRRGDVLERAIYYAEYRGDLLLLYEVSDEESGAGVITRLDGRTLAAKWKRSIPGFNVGQGLIENGHAYVTAIGFVGKVNLETGAYAWRHGKLYRSAPMTANNFDDDFNSFKLPKIEGDFVLFQEFDVYPTPVKTLKVNKQSGRIISIE